MNPPEVEDELRRLMQRLEDETYALAPLLEAAARSEVDAKTAYAKAYLSAEGPVSTREQRATLDSAEPVFARRVAEGKVTAQREVLSMIRTQVDGLRTIAANMRGLT